MAEIDIQKRERSTWPWIIGALLLLLLLLWWFLWRPDPEEQVASATAPVVAAAAGSTDEPIEPASEFQAFVNERQADFGQSHEHTAEGLRLLAGALESTISRDSLGATAVAPRIAELRQQADAIQREPESLRHSDMVRRAMMAGAGLIGDVSARGGTTIDSGAVSAAAEAMDPSRPLLEQTETITQFFNAAAAALREVGTAR